MLVMADELSERKVIDLICGLELAIQFAMDISAMRASDSPSLLSLSPPLLLSASFL